MYLVFVIINKMVFSKNTINNIHFKKNNMSSR
jgi:hypothetical protein